MARFPCRKKNNVKRGKWTPEEDDKLSSYVAQHGCRNWRLVAKNAGLRRCGRSCRNRWTNYLRPELKHGQFTDTEELTIVKLHSIVGNRWSLIAAQLHGRTDNDVKNYWNTKLKRKLARMGIDPLTHRPYSRLMAEIAFIHSPVSNLAEAALGCFKQGNSAKWPVPRDVGDKLNDKIKTSFKGPITRTRAKRIQQGTDDLLAQLGATADVIHEPPWVTMIHRRPDASRAT